MSRAAFSERLTHRGIVLPVVLVMLVLMTTVVLYLMRRSAVDERMAANTRDVTTVETAAQFALRFCELWLWTSPPGINPQTGRPDPPRVVLAPVAPATAAWRTNLNWTNSAVTLGASTAEVQALLPGVDEARCLIEDATAELELGASDSGNRLLLANTWRKYRITAEVQGPGAGSLRIARAQSEVRMNVN
jgi:Tfp pilus assembly protein PilX